MSKRVLLPLIILAAFMSACSKRTETPDSIKNIQENNKIQWENVDYDRTAAYQSILEEYEHALEDKNYTEEQWENIYDCVIGDKYFLGTTVFYSVEDIAKDGTAELIIGL